MAKFCTNCGKKLVNGKCDCEKKETKEEVITNGSDLINEYIDAIKGIFIKPVDTMKKYTKKANLTLSVIMVVLNSIIFGLFAYLFVKENVGAIMPYAYLGGYEVPASVFFIFFLLMLVFFFCLAGLLYLFTNKIMKTDSNFKELMTLISVNSVFTTITTLLALIFIFINIWVASFIILVSSLIYLINIYHGFSQYTKIDKNKICYIFTTCYVITMFVVCYILPKIFS